MLGTMVCGSIALFWIIRAASEFMFYPAPSLVLAIICLGIAALYAGRLPMTRSAQLSAG